MKRVNFEYLFLFKYIPALQFLNLWKRFGKQAPIKFANYVGLHWLYEDGPGFIRGKFLTLANI